jgi:hypothetical protein
MLGCDAMKCLTCCANVGVHMHRRPLVICRQPLVHPAIRRFIFVCVCVYIAASERHSHTVPAGCTTESSNDAEVDGDMSP